MTIKWRKINRVLHRDLGYFFTGMILVYALSGIALNHIDDWNPNYVIKVENHQLQIPENFDPAEKEDVISLVEEAGIAGKYKNHYFPEEGKLKVFLEKGSSIVVDMATGSATLESIRRRMVFYEINYLHYNPGEFFKWFSDIFAVSLIILAISGLFILKGKNGLKWRGTIIAGTGVLVIIILLLFYLS